MISQQRLNNNIPPHTDGQTRSVGNPEGIVDNRQRFDPNYSEAGTTDQHGHNNDSIPRDPPAGEKNHPSDPNSFGPGVATGQDGGATAGVNGLHDYDFNSGPHNFAAAATNRPSNPSPLKPSTGPDSQNPRAHIQERLSQLGNGPTPAGGAPGVATGQHNPTAGVTNSHEHDSISTPQNLPEGKMNHPSNPSSPKPFNDPDARDSTSLDGIQERSSHSGDRITPGGMPSVASGQHPPTSGVTKSHDQDSVSTPHNLPEGRTDLPPNTSSPKPFTGPDTRDSPSSHARLQERSSHSGDKITTSAGGMPSVATGQHTPTPGVTNSHDHGSVSTPHNLPEGKTTRPSDPSSPKPTTGLDTRDATSSEAHTQERSLHSGDKITPAGEMSDAADGQHSATAGFANSHDRNSSSSSHNPPEGESVHASGPNPSDPSTGPDLHHPASPSAHTKEHSSNLGNKTTAGGVRPDAATEHNRKNHPAHVSRVDKVIGAAEEVVGRITRNPERTEKGQLRGVGGAPAVHGGARAIHA